MDVDRRTLWCGNLSNRVTEEILYELFLQGGPVQRVSIPKDRDGRQRSYGFVTYKHDVSVSYALDLFDGTMLFDKPINMKMRNTVDLDKTENYQNQSPNMLQALQLGQQMMFPGNSPIMMIDMIGMNMLPTNLTYSKQVSPSGKNEKRSRRTHPYYRESDRDNNHHRDHRSHRSKHSNHHNDDYSRRDNFISRRYY
ncbi:hypothetical protein KM043_001080 [Ampulex compressa]|nr:hypothetical protein KM043_001080 [Ampulex compressa]